MRKVAIVIAIEAYSDRRISSVKYAEADAQDFVSALQLHGFDAADQMVLINAALADVHFSADQGATLTQRLA